MTRRLAFSAGAVALLTAAPAFAQDQEHVHHFHHRRGTPPPGTPRTFDRTDERVGFARFLSPHAGPTNTPMFGGYYVGGGAVTHGDGRFPQEGTWGWDYFGHIIPRR